MSCILVNTPISSPIHPQVNLPLLSGYLSSFGYKVKVIDSNIRFFHYFLKDNEFEITLKDCYENPIKILSYFNNIQKTLFEKSKDFIGLDVGLRYLSMKYNRMDFDQVIDSLDDRGANPFIAFFENLVNNEIIKSSPKVLGIAITFQDQIIPSFTLAKKIRELLPDVKIVMGGQMITRCYNTLISHDGLAAFYDYLSLWDGEKTLHDILKKVIDKENVSFVNVIENNNKNYSINRKGNSPKGTEIPNPDFSDINFKDYYFPEMLVPFQTTRGCYGECDFCAIPFGSNSYKIRPLEEIINDLISIQEHTEKRYGKKARFFKFMEDTSSPALLYSLSREIEKRKLDIKWETFARLEEAFTKAGFMEQLYRGGCRKIHWGLESNDPDVLKDMNKKITVSYSDRVLELSAKAGILNFCFVLIGFPGETDESRNNITKYVIDNKNIHTITIATFDLTRGAPMEQNFKADNQWGLDMEPAKGFQVRLPYTVNGTNWKEKIVSSAQNIMLEILKKRPDIGFMTLFPDQIRAMYCDKYTNNWANIFLEKYGEENIKTMLTNTEKYIDDYKNNRNIDSSLLPEPLRREHLRTKEDMELIANALIIRKNYENRRVRQV